MSTRPKKLTTGNASLPPALSRRNAKLAGAKHKRLVAEAHALLDLVQRRKRAIAEAFYDIGEALERLRQKDMLAALGRSTFAELCEKDAGISASTGQRLVEVVRSMSREQAITMGQKKAMAMVAIAAATPEADTPAGLYRKKAIALPGGRALSPRKASANELEEAAAAIRQAKGTARRGRTTTPEERLLAAQIEKRLHALGLTHARVTAVATKPGQGADLRFEHVPLAKVALLKKALGR